ncbi:MAG: putative sulfate exporter family transporter, partial [Ignavibacteriaceae bacterium]|nr:putative sulfate exporter family transporter [Ignavibacteriaceae bacterium]
MAEENQSQNHDDQIVIDHTSSKLSDLWKLEDYWAIWLGFLILIVGLILFLPKGSEEVNNKIIESNIILQTESKRAPFKTIAWYKALDTKANQKATKTEVGREIKKLTGKPKLWSGNPLDAFYLGEEEANFKREVAEEKYLKAKDEEAGLLELAIIAEEEAAAKNFNSEELNLKAVTAIENWRIGIKNTSLEKKKVGVEPFNQFPYLILLMIILAIFFGIGWKAMGNPILKFVLGFIFVFTIAVLAYT